MTPIYCDTMPSPVGALLLAASNEGLTHVLFLPLAKPDLSQSWLAVDRTVNGVVEDARDTPQAIRYLQLAREQLEQYFDGTRQTFTVPLAASGTEFQRTVWRALTEIPYGDTWSYGDVAARIGSPKSMRAVGLANGRNPLSIVVPCHRVIGANGALTGYGGGIERKQQLLTLECEAALSSTVSH